MRLSSLLALAAVALYAPVTGALKQGYSPRPACKIFRLDLATLPKAADGSPAAACSVNHNFTVNLYNGVSYLAATAPVNDPWFQRAEHITAGQHAGPWYVAEALKRGAGVATMEEADKIYVDDYCFFTWWMSYVHSYGGDTSKWPMDQYPGGEMVTLYHSLIKHPRWVASGGKDFVFFMPHPGMDHGPAHPSYNQLICEAFQGATFIVVERMQRLICNDFRQPIVVPYTSNSKTHTCPMTPMPETGLLFYKGRCTPPKDFAAEGIALRHKVVSALPKRDDITVQCSPEAFDPTIQPESHMDLLESMSQHRFSLVLPGDTSSSRRLTDTMLAKSIPVFVGPPFHSLPFSDTVDYRAFAVFINVSSANVFLAGEKAGQPSNYKWHLPAGPTSDRGGSGHPGWLGQSEWYSPAYAGGRSATHAILDEICLSTPQGSVAEE
ncbi:hypothetical protein WJX73_002999 [Symbiochloris irregularis]|uniref:Exostosin GT47 domain-containing protein n=1 Tax=Symbiochloris irregularis TaxID=706552 RepID=A0AAW1P9A8_9CHLO